MYRLVDCFDIGTSVPVSFLHCNANGIKQRKSIFHVILLAKLTSLCTTICWIGVNGLNEDQKYFNTWYCVNSKLSLIIENQILICIFISGRKCGPFEKISAIGRSFDLENSWKRKKSDKCNAVIRFEHFSVPYYINNNTIEIGA